VKRRKFLVTMAGTAVALPGCGGSSEAEASSGTESLAAGPSSSIDTPSQPSQPSSPPEATLSAAPPTPAVAGEGQWEELIVAPHERIIVHYGNATRTNAGGSVTRSAIPYRDWGGFTVSPEGIAYYLGGGHSNYHGTEVEVCDLKQMVGRSMPWRQNLGGPFPEHGALDDFKRPHAPDYPNDPADGVFNSGYGSAGSNWMWFNPRTPGAWQHDACHMYTTTTTHPALGLIVGMYNVPNNLVMPANIRDHSTGLKSWSAATGKWTAHVAHPDVTINSGLFGDFNRQHNYILWAEVPGSRDRVRFVEWSPSGGLRTGPWMSVPLSTLGVSHEGGCLWLSGHKFLIFRGAQNGTAALWLYDHSLTSPSLTRVTSELHSSTMSSTPENGYWCADYDSQKVWWLVGQASRQPKLYYAPISDPTNFREFAFVDSAEFRPSDNAVTTSGMRGLQYWGGHLWFTTMGGGDLSFDTNTWRARFWRLRVG
jgi:hypothetical protein